MDSIFHILKEMIDRSRMEGNDATDEHQLLQIRKKLELQLVQSLDKADIDRRKVRANRRQEMSSFIAQFSRNVGI